MKSMVERVVEAVKQDAEIKDRDGTQPAKYYAKDAEGDKMSKSTKQSRARHFEKGTAKDDDDPSAYEPAPGDKGAKTKLSKHTIAVRKKFPELYKEDADTSLQKKADASGIPKGILKQVYKRGVAAWRTGHRPGTTPEQWGHARVNSFISKGKGTWGKADSDLAAKVRKEEFNACCSECEHMAEGLEHEDILIIENGEKKNVTLNKPQRGGSKKFYVYVKNDKGNVVKVSFGDPNMEIKRDDPARRKSFRARHNCDNPGPKWKARYWSCRQWRAGSAVED